MIRQIAESDRSDSDAFPWHGLQWEDDDPGRSGTPGVTCVRPKAVVDPLLRKRSGSRLIDLAGPLLLDAAGGPSRQCSAGHSIIAMPARLTR